MSRRVSINLIAFVSVFALMCWWAVNNIITFDFIERPYRISASFAGTAGVSENSEVAYLGVGLGSVDSVQMDDGEVLVTMSIDRGREIPAGSTAHIFRKSAIGEPYIDFSPPENWSEGDPTIQPGAHLGIEETTVPLEFSELLRAASRILESVDPGQTRTLIHELAVALDGRGESLRDLTVSSDALLQTFAERTDLLDSLTSNSTRLTRTVAERRESLSSAVGDLAALAETVRTIEPETTVLLERGTELLGQAADLVSDVKGDLDCILHDLDDVIDVTSSDANLESLAYTLDNGPTGLGYVWMTRDHEPGGLWVRVHLIVEFAEPAGQYVPPRQLPAVPEIPACVSTLSSSGGVDFERGPGVASAVPVGSGTLPATGGEPVAVLALVLVAGAAFTVAARRAVRP